MATILKDKVMIEGMTLSAVIWKKFRKQPIGFLEKVMDLNPDIVEDQIIAVGTVISFPVEELDAKPTSTKTVRLWD